MKPSIVAPLALLALAACASEPASLSVTDRDTIAACRAHANQVYDRLNRDAIYSTSDNGAPYSSTGLVGDPTAGLSARFAQERMIRRCVSGIKPLGTPVGPPGAAPATAPAPAAPDSPPPG